MAPIHEHDYGHHSFLRRVPPHVFQIYLHSVNHPKQQSIMALFSDAEKEDVKGKRKQAYQQTAALLGSDENPNRQDDDTRFRAINDMCNPEGHNALMHWCELRGRDDLIQQYPTAEELAMVMYAQHHDWFVQAHLFTQMQQATGWKLYMGIKPSALKPWADVEGNFVVAVRNTLQKVGRGGQHVFVDAYEEPTRLILNIQTEGPLKMQDMIDEDGVHAQRIRPPVEYALVYYPNTGALKIKAPPHSKAVMDALHQDFANTVLVTPQNLLSIKFERAVNLDEFRNFRELTPPPEHVDDIISAHVTSMTFKVHPKDKTTYTIHNPIELYNILRERQLSMVYADIRVAKVQFKYLLGGKKRQTTIKLVASTNNVTTNTSDVGEMLEACLMHWNIINV